ncbi:MAG TPA: hypothetical protein VEJ63_00485 [Planctomycetota bacterium]|nr:hypothetical protein [Planctomycetota bacterium]
MRRHLHRVILIAALQAISLFAQTAPTNLLYVLNNDPAGNAITIIQRTPENGFVMLGVVPTGGRGLGHGLESQAPLQSNENGTLLFAVNAASDTVSVLRVSGTTLELIGTYPSGGTLPVSVAVRGNRVYVLNQGSGGNVAGFTLGEDGALTPIPGGTKGLSAAGTGGAQAAFTPDGTRLVVTELLGNVISIYPVNENGTLGDADVYRSRGRGPFGFSFDARGFLLVSEAFGRGSGLSSASSYTFRKERLRPLSGAISTLQRAACWLVVTSDTHLAFTSNTPSGTITAFSVSERGRLRRIPRNGISGDTGPSSAPTEMALSPDQKTLYAICVGTRQLAAFSIAPDGTLTASGVVDIPAFGAGLIAR